MPMFRASTRKLDSSSISIRGRSLISCAGISVPPRIAPFAGVP
jgi:hypothetical protein